MEFKATIDGKLRQWYADVGDIVEADEPLVEIETHAVDVDLLAPIAGRITEMMVLPGDAVTKGMVLARIEPVQQSIGALIDEQARKSTRKKQPELARRSPSRQLIFLMLAGMVLLGAVIAGVTVSDVQMITLENDGPVNPALIATGDGAGMPLASRPTATLSGFPGPTPTAVFHNQIGISGDPIHLVVAIGNSPAGTLVRISSTQYDLETDTRYYEVVNVSSGEVLTVTESQLALGYSPSFVPTEPTMVFSQRSWSWFYPLRLKESLADFPIGTAVQIVDARFDGNGWQLRVITESGTELNVRESQLEPPANSPLHPQQTPVVGLVNYINLDGYPLVTIETIDHIPVNTPVRILDFQAGFGEWVYRIVMEGDQRVAAAHETQLQFNEHYTERATAPTPP